MAVLMADGASVALQAAARDMLADPGPDADAAVRQDLTHMAVLAIDDASTVEVDDGVSAEVLADGQVQTGQCTTRFWNTLWHASCYNIGDTCNPYGAVSCTEVRSQACMALCVILRSVKGSGPEGTWSGSCWPSWSIWQYEVLWYFSISNLAVLW